VKPESPVLTGDSVAPADRIRSLIAILTSAGIAGLTFGLSIPLVSLVLESRGVPATWIGFNQAAAALAILAVSPFVPTVLQRFGVLGAMYVAVAGIVVIFLIMPLWIDPWFWVLLRFLMGACVAIHWITSETWILTIARKESRGRTVAIYTTILAGGFACGPLLIRFIGIEGTTPFVVCAALLTVSAVPLILAYGRTPKFPPHTGLPLRRMFQIAPLVLLAAVLAGFTDMSLLALLPVYGIRMGLDQGTAVIMLTIMLLGNLALQWPLGWLADHWDRRRLLLLCAALFVVGPVLMPVVIHTSVWLWTLLVLWGAASLGVYTLGLTLLGERFTGGDLARANAAFVAFYEIGSLTGPPLGGVGMDLLGPNGLMWVLAIASGAYVVLARLRRHQWK
jgi:MFS family permease